ncbi:MAG: hypothetical protein ABEJ73_04040 [Haloplanus sp.]
MDAFVALGPTVVADTPTVVRSAVAAATALLVGGILLTWFEGLLDRSVDAAVERPVLTIPYGAVAFGGVGFLGAFGYSQLIRVVGSGGAATVVGALVVLVWLALAGFGFAVVGTAATAVWGARDPAAGVVVGAAISGGVWLAPTVGVGLALWATVGAIGVGGPARRWIHASRSVDGEH